MEEKCSTKTDFLFFEHDFTDEKELQLLKDAGKLVTIYRKIRDNRYIKDCYIRSHLLSILSAESANQITYWGQGRYEQRLRKLGLLPAIDELRSKGEYITDFSIKLLNMFDVFELVECSFIRVGSQSGGVGVIHGSEEIVCKLSPIELASQEEIDELNSRTNVTTLYKVCPEYNERFVNINDKIYRRIIRVIPDYNLGPNVPIGIYVGQIDEKRREPRGYGIYLSGEAYKNKSIIDTERNRTELECSNWNSKECFGANYRIYRRNNEYQLVVSYDETDNNEITGRYSISFNINFSDNSRIGFRKHVRTTKWPLSIIITKDNRQIKRRDVVIEVFRNRMDEVTNYIEEFYLKLYAFLFLATIDYDKKYEIIKLISLNNFNLEDITNCLSAMLRDNQLDIEKHYFLDDELVNILSVYIDPDDYTQKLEELFGEDIEPRTLSFDEEDEEEISVTQVLPDREEDEEEFVEGLFSGPLEGTDLIDENIAGQFDTISLNINHPDSLSTESARNDVEEATIEQLQDAYDDLDALIAYNQNEEYPPLLFQAVELEFTELVRFLLINNADVDIEWNGQTVLQYYFQNRFYDNIHPGEDEDSHNDKVLYMIRLILDKAFNKRQYIDRNDLLSEYELPDYVSEFLTDMYNM